MLVVLLMACKAIGRRFVLVEVPFVARRARGRKVLPTERVFGVQIVIEGGRFPVTGSMAGFAFVSVGPFMFVVLFVT
jgi:hypothetical protein